MSAVDVRELRKTFDVPEREAGLRAAARGLVRRRTREGRAVAGISFSIEPGACGNPHCANGMHPESNQQSMTSGTRRISAPQCGHGKTT